VLRSALGADEEASNNLATNNPGDVSFANVGIELNSSVLADVHRTEYM